MFLHVRLFLARLPREVEILDREIVSLAYEIRKFHNNMRREKVGSPKYHYYDGKLRKFNRDLQHLKKVREHKAKRVERLARRGTRKASKTQTKRGNKRTKS